MAIEYYNPREESQVKDKDFENKIRPQDFTSFHGQQKIIDKLEIYVKAASFSRPSRPGKDYSCAYSGQRAWSEYENHFRSCA